MFAVEKASFGSLRANFGAVLRNTFQADQSFRKQNPEHLLHEVLQCGAVGDPKIAQYVVVHYLHAGQPLQSRLMLHLPTDLPRARNASRDRKSTRLNSSHANISYAVFCLKKKNKRPQTYRRGF